MNITPHRLFIYHKRKYWGDILEDLRHQPCLDDMSSNGLLQDIVSEDFQIINAYYEEIL